MARRHSPEFKLEVVRSIESGEKRPMQACREHGLDSKMVREWRRKYRAEGEEAFTGGRQASLRAVIERYERRIAELERMVGRLALENEVLKRGRGLARGRSQKGTR